MSARARLALLAFTVPAILFAIAQPVLATIAIIVAAVLVVADVATTREHDPVPPLYPIDDEPWI